MNTRTVDDLNSEKSMNGGFGVRMCVFFSFTCEMEINLGIKHGIEECVCSIKLCYIIQERETRE